MIARVWDRACRAKKLDKVIVATEDIEIYNVLSLLNIPCQLTPPCQNGTERILWVAQQLSEPITAILNIQGDEPCIEPAHIEAALAPLDRGFDIGTLVTPLENPHNIARVKAVFSQEGRALYFSRQPIPHQGPHFLHLGIYAFSPAALARIPHLSPSPLEQSESLEQLRWLEAGLGIGIEVVNNAEAGVDTPEDLERVRAYYRAGR